MKLVFTLMLALVASLSLAGVASAATSVDSPNPVQTDTIRLNWTGQGTTGNAYDNTLCGTEANPGPGGFENGATADDYIHWIFTTDGGSTVANATLTINGTTYNSFDGQHIVTPSYAPADITDAHANFVVDETGGGSWVLTISHGCLDDGTVREIVEPSGGIGGPCADPAYYGIFDNTQSDVAVKFRFRWFTSATTLRTIVKVVPAGAIFRTWEKWVKPFTTIRVGYWSTELGRWVNLASEQSVKGTYPACVYQRGFEYPNPA